MSQTRSSPGNPERFNFSFFRFLSFDALLAGGLFRKMADFFSLVDEAQCTWATLDPHPAEYFHRNFGVYSVVRINPFFCEDRFLSLLHSDLGDSPADALAYSTTVACMYGGSDRWFLHADRELELMVIGLATRKDANSFDSVFEAEAIRPENLTESNTHLSADVLEAIHTSYRSE